MIGQIYMGSMNELNNCSKKEHIPVMLEEVINGLAIKDNGIYVDCTLGLGGHAKRILSAIKGSGKFIGIDKDESSLEQARRNLVNYFSISKFIKDDFRNIALILKNLKIEKVDGVLIDLGISSFQLDDPKRGFSLQHDGPLDMRMDTSGAISAFDLVNSLSEKEIANILKDFGEERWHNRIAHSIVFQRARSPITTTQELKEVVLNSMPYCYQKEKIHPATRTFQALRIAVNRELESLTIALNSLTDYLNVGGRIVVIAFHSLEDRIVKTKFRDLQNQNKVQIITNKPLRPSIDEINQNSRSRSARLRIVERI